MISEHLVKLSSYLQHHPSLFAMPWECYTCGDPPVHSLTEHEEKPTAVLSFTALHKKGLCRLNDKGLLKSPWMKDS